MLATNLFSTGLFSVLSSQFSNTIKRLLSQGPSSLVLLRGKALLHEEADFLQVYGST